MIMRTWLAIALFGFVVASAPTPASAEVTVSLQINGSVEEILSILQLLQEHGFGKGTASFSDQALKLQMNSVASSEPAPRPAEPAPPAPPLPPPAIPEPPKPEPRLALQSPVAVPDTVKPGEPVVLMVKVVDPDKRVDTVAARQGEAGGALEFVDDGKNGDAVAGDGIWTCRYTVDANAPEGELKLVVSAFDVNGAPMSVSDAGGAGVPVHAGVVVHVKK